jgi:hypothetical protein
MAGRLDPLCPEAVKWHQTAVHAPTWGIVTCDTCKEEFFIGPHRFHGSRIDAEECAKRVDALLGEDHKHNRAHPDSYEIPD